MQIQDNEQFNNLLKQKQEIVVIGAGIAGVLTALELADKGYQIVLIEKYAEILSGTSDRTPCRLGLGLHYMDEKTAKEYFLATLKFVKKFPEFRLKMEDDNLQGSDYLLMEDSQFDYLDVANIQYILRNFYKKLIEQDMGNKLFGDPEEFIKPKDRDERFANTEDRHLLLLGELSDKQLEKNNLYLYLKNDNDKDKKIVCYKCRKDNEEIIDVQLADNEFYKTLLDKNKIETKRIIDAVEKNQLHELPNEDRKRFLKFAFSQGHVLPSRMILSTYKTQEEILDWPRLKDHLIHRVKKHDNIKLLTNTQVESFADNDCDEDGIYDSERTNYKINCKKSNGTEIFSLETNKIVNASWYDIDRLNKTLNHPSGESHCKRPKAMVEIELPEGFKDIRTSFACFGPFFAITNLGDYKIALMSDKISELERNTLYIEFESENKQKIARYSVVTLTGEAIKHVEIPNGLALAKPYTLAKSYTENNKNLVLDPTDYAKLQELTSKQGHTRGRRAFVLYEHLYNTQTTDEILPEEMQKFMDGKAKPEEVEKIAQAVLAGVNRFLPGIGQAKILDTKPGIVMTSGGPVAIYDKNSPHHKRSEHGTGSNEIDFYNNASYKLLYGVTNATEIADLMEKHKIIGESQEFRTTIEELGKTFSQAKEHNKNEIKINKQFEKQPVEQRVITHFFRKHFKRTWIDEDIQSIQTMIKKKKHADSKMLKQKQKVIISIKQEKPVMPQYQVIFKKQDNEQTKLENSYENTLQKKLLLNEEIVKQAWVLKKDQEKKPVEQSEEEKEKDDYEEDLDSSLTEESIHSSSPPTDEDSMHNKCSSLENIFNSPSTTSSWNHDNDNFGDSECFISSMNSSMEEIINSSYTFQDDDSEYFTNKFSKSCFTPVTDYDKIPKINESKNFFSWSNNDSGVSKMVDFPRKNLKINQSKYFFSWSNNRRISKIVDIPSKKTTSEVESPPSNSERIKFI